MRVIVVGAVAGGASAAARIKRLDETAQVTVFEKGEHVSFSNCCLPYHLSGTVADSEELILMEPKDFRKRFDIDVRVHSEVVSVDRIAKTVTVCCTESGAYIVDVRESGEYNAGHPAGAHNVPLTRLRQRMAEIPRDVPVYLHCRSGQRSYYALCCLRGHGYQNVTNISGSFPGISLYEYFHDKMQGRTPIVTAYNFR